MKRITYQEGQEIAANQERRGLFLGYINRGWLIFGIVTLVALPFFPEERSLFIYLLGVIFPTCLLIWLLHRSGRTRFAGVIFTIVVNFGFYGLFLISVHELGAEEAFRTQATIWMLMGLAVLFGGSLVDKLAAPLVASIDTVLFIGTRLALAPGSDPRPSLIVFWWMMAIIIWLYESTLQRTFARVWKELAERKETEGALRESEKRYRLLAENVTDVIWTMDMNLRSTYTSPSVKRMRGYDAGDAVAQSLEQALTPASLELAAKALEEELAKEKLPEKDLHRSRTLELEVIRKDGSTVCVETKMTFLRDPDGIPVEILGVNRDITERKRAAETLARSEARFARIFEASPIPITLSRAADGTYLAVNESFLRFSGYARDEVLGHSVVDLQIYPEPEMRAKLLSRLREHGRLENYEQPFRTKSGVVKDSSLWLEPVSINNEACILAMALDVTERKLAEEMLREAETKFRNLVERLPTVIYTAGLGANAQWSYVSPQIESLLGFTAAEWMADPGLWYRQLHPEDRDRQIELEAQAWAQGELFDSEYRIFRSDGREIWIRDTAQILSMQDGKPVAQGTLLDITERKGAEEEIRRRADEFSALYETARDLAAQYELPTLLDKIVERARTLLHASGGGIYLYDPACGDLEMVLAVGASVPIGARLHMGEGVAGRVAQTRQPLRVDDYRTWGGRSLQYETIPFRAVLQAPMLFAGELIGVLSVNEVGASERKFTETDASLLSLFAEYASGAVHAARLLQETGRRAEETTALLETSLALTSLDLETTLQTIGAQAKSLFAADGCRIFLMEADGETLRCVLALQENIGAFSHLRIKIGEGVTGEVAASGQAEIVNEMQNDPRAVQVPGTPEEQEAIMFAPLKEGERTIGVLSVRRTGAGRVFQPTDLELLKAFASMAASAVSNARLLEETQRRLERLSILRQIDQVISSSLDLRVTLNILLGHIMQQLEVDAATVLLYQPELQSLEFVAGLGFRTRALQSTYLRLGQGFAGQAALERHIVQVSDLSKMRTGFLRSPEFRNEGFVAYVGVPLIAKGKITGVLEIYHRKPLNTAPEWMEFLETLAGQAAIAIDNIRLFEDLQSSNLQLLQAYDATIEGWAQALELRDMEIQGHSHRVVDTTLELARKMGIQESQLAHIRWGALLHDIGKMGVPDAILQKAGALTDTEWEIMRQHPVFAYKWLSPILYLKPSLDIPYCHHEKWDGTGYPRGLKGEQIPLAARIFAVADVWDALTSDRPYRKPWTQEQALEYIKEQSGHFFDPKVVDVFLELIV